LRRILRPTRVEIAGDWRKLDNEELQKFYSSTNRITIIKSRWMRWTQHVASMEKSMNSYGVLVGKREGKSTLEITRCRRQDNIKMKVTEI
jgi:hypothetical protein